MHRNEIVLSKASDPGLVREENEDYLDSFEPEDSEALERLGCLMVVADGMGGHRSGYTASHLAVEALRVAYLASEGDAAEALEEAFIEANRAVFEKGLSDRKYRGMGTTLTALVLVEGAVMVANVGDSRAYRIREGDIEQLTTDHSMVAEQVKSGDLTEEEARDHPDSNVITRCIGTSEEVLVDLFGPFEVYDGDRFLLCTDGLHGLVDDDELAEVAWMAPPQDACTELILRANQRGGYDNVTVQIVHVGDITEHERKVSPSVPPRPSVTRTLALGRGLSEPQRPLPVLGIVAVLAFILGATLGFCVGHRSPPCPAPGVFLRAERREWSPSLPLPELIYEPVVGVSVDESDPGEAADADPAQDEPPLDGGVDGE